MQFEWDEAKAELNLVKHQISFQEAISVFVDTDLVVEEVSRQMEGERRWKAIGVIGNRRFAVVFTLRGKVMRMISARRTNKKEDARYGYR